MISLCSRLRLGLPAAGATLFRKSIVAEPGRPVKNRRGACDRPPKMKACLPRRRGGAGMACVYPGPSCWDISSVAAPQGFRWEQAQTTGGRDPFFGEAASKSEPSALQEERIRRLFCSAPRRGAIGRAYGGRGRPPPRRMIKSEGAGCSRAAVRRASPHQTAAGTAALPGGCEIAPRRGALLKGQARSLWRTDGPGRRRTDCLSPWLPWL